MVPAPAQSDGRALSAPCGCQAEATGNAPNRFQLPIEFLTVSWRVLRTFDTLENTWFSRPPLVTSAVRDDTSLGLRERTLDAAFFLGVVIRTSLRGLVLLEELSGHLTTAAALWATSPGAGSACQYTDAARAKSFSG